MIRICSYCKAYMGEKEPIDDTRVTHSICPECHKKVMDEIEEVNPCSKSLKYRDGCCGLE